MFVPMAERMALNSSLFEESLRMAEFRDLRPECDRQVICSEGNLLVYHGENEPPEPSMLRLQSLFALQVAKQQGEFSVLMVNHRSPSYSSYRRLVQLVKGLPEKHWVRLRHVYVYHYSFINKLSDFLSFGDISHAYTQKLVQLQEQDALRAHGIDPALLRARAPEAAPLPKRLVDFKLQRGVPAVLLLLGNSLVSNQSAIKELGIFRTTIEYRELDRLTQLCLRQDLAQLSKIKDGRTLACVIKRLLSSFVQPLVPGEVMSALGKAGYDPRLLRQRLRMLPKEHLQTLEFLAGVLRQVASFQGQNKMSESNLAICLAPTLSGPSQSMSKMEEIVRVLKLLILHRELVFDSPL